MAKFTKFGLDNNGILVYRSTGAAVPEKLRAGYSIRGNTVYGSDGRKIGNVGKGTAAEQRKIRKTAAARTRRLSKTPKKIPSGRTQKTRFSFKNIRTARQLAVNQPLRRPPMSADDKRAFGKGVRNMAAYSARYDTALVDKINRMTDENLAQLYQENEIVFEVYFDYGGIQSTEKGMVSSKQTADNAQYLVDKYEERFGPIYGTIQTTL